ncbi:uncharacterized protein EMH_0082190 [Eimeria mitis]|uniref:Polycystin cation channel PKD1/PKD2 domain-containing protein n=1 Tax=Eimeria mitis TaxID=44415 RepID=U6KLR7_9EIME|nr:uncharacterized protein EMH_0082190 [Eimeria mitis]CDJ36378.1 hypothetical protein EMH_0082190 [Eimeria mitis]
MLAFMFLYLLCEYMEMKKLGFKSWLKGGWTIFLLFHLLVLFGLLSAFAAVQFIAVLAPEIKTAVAGDGYYNILEAPSAISGSGFFQLVDNYYSLFRANDAAQQACIIFGSLTGLTGCVLVTRLIPATAGIGTKSLQMTFHKVKFYIVASSVGMLAIVLVFVSLGNISFGVVTRSFTGYYERQAHTTLTLSLAQAFAFAPRFTSLEYDGQQKGGIDLTTSAAFLLGGTLGNYNLYTMTSVNPILAGIFFVPLFLVFSAFGFTVVTAVVLRKYDFCAESVQQGVIKYKLGGQDVFRTRYEWLVHSVKSGCTGFWKAVTGCWKTQRVALLDEPANHGLDDDIEEARKLKEKKKAKRRLRFLGKKKGKDFYRREQHEEEERSSVEEDDNSPPQYPPWVWNVIGMEDPRNKYAFQSGDEREFYVDPASIGAYSRTYGRFSGFNVAGVTDRSNWYFTPDIPCTHLAEDPAPSVAKVYVLVRNQIQEDHEDAWKKLFVIAFVAIIVATVSLQVSSKEMPSRPLDPPRLPGGDYSSLCE